MLLLEPLRESGEKKELIKSCCCCCCCGSGMIYIKYDIIVVVFICVSVFQQCFVFLFINIIKKSSGGCFKLFCNAVYDNMI